MRYLKPILLAILLLLAINTALGVTVTREMPSSTQLSDDINVTFDISEAEVGSVFSLEEQVPTGFKLQKWKISGAGEDRDTITTSFEGTKYSWSFTPVLPNVKISYVVKPTSEGIHTFSATWTSESGTDSDEHQITLENLLCGNNICEGFENCGTCAADCACASNTRCEVGKCTTFCGNNVCDRNENSQNCAQDCPVGEAPAKSSDQSIFDKKKEKRKANVLFFVIPLLVLLIGFGVHQMRRKKGGKSFGSIDMKEVKATVERAISPKEDTGEETKRVIERTSNELPSFEEGSLDVELPSLETEDEKTEEVSPEPEPEDKERAASEEPEKKKSELGKKIKEVDKLVDKVFSRKEE